MVTLVAADAAAGFCVDAAAASGDPYGAASAAIDGGCDGGTWGALIEVAEEHAEASLRALDFREKAGYVRERRAVQCADGEMAEALVFSTAPDSALLVRGESIEETARVIAAAAGPSGPNAEYLHKLHDA